MFVALTVRTDVLDEVPPWAIVIFCCAVIAFALSSWLSRPTSVKLREGILWTVIALAVLGELTQEPWVVVTLTFLFALLVTVEVARQVHRHVGDLQRGRAKEGPS